MLTCNNFATPVLLLCQIVIAMAAARPLTAFFGPDVLWLGGDAPSWEGEAHTSTNREDPFSCAKSNSDLCLCFLLRLLAGLQVFALQTSALGKAHPKRVFSPGNPGSMKPCDCLIG